MGTTTDDGADGGVDSRQVLLVGLCLFGLVTASFLAPVTGANAPVGGGDGGLLADVLSELVEFLTTGREPGDSGDDPPAGGGGGEGDGGGGLPEWLAEILRELFDEGDGGGGGGEGPGEADCRVLVENNPAPGTETTVRVLDGGEPQPGVRVWFNDRYVGETNDEGEVTGEVPYVDQLNVTVQSEATCTFSDQPSVGAVAGNWGSAAAVGAPLLGAMTVDGSGGIGGDTAAQTGDDGGVNSSGEVQVDGNAVVELIGEPYPNSTVELVARVGSAPIPDANISVDGQRVGQTDESGRYRLSVPDRDSIRITVSRATVSGSTTIDVWQLRVGFVPRLTVPGETVTANVTTPGGPVSNASVALDGRHVGDTAADGRVRFAAPASVGGSVSATTPRQSTTVPLWRIYAVTAGASALLIALSTVSTAVVARRSGRARARRVGVGWLAVATLFVGYAVWELPGLLGALALLALVWLFRNREAVRSGSLTAAALTERYLARCQRLVLGVVSWLETLVDLVRAETARLVAWVHTLPSSLSGLARRLRAWLARLPSRVRTAVASLSPRFAAVAAVAVLFVLAATVLLGARGFVLSTALVFLAFVGWKVIQHSPDRDSESVPTTDDRASTGRPSPEGGSGRLSLRALWRRLAQWVLPEAWHTRTPAEISRAAIDAGLPREPVERLTEAFRDVEYGGAAESSRIDEAWQAYESLEAAEEEEP